MSYPRSSSARVACLLAGLVVAACSRAPLALPPTAAAAAASVGPSPPPARWLDLLGEYGTGDARRIVAEHDGRLALISVVDSSWQTTLLTERSADEFSMDGGAQVIRFVRDARGRGRELAIGAARAERQAVGPEAGSNQLVVKPVRPVSELRAEALAATPPKDTGAMRAHELVELTALDPTLRLEIRYASTNNFLGTRFYDEARAFLQRPAADATVRAHRALRARGFGLLVHDAYRPWYVTRMFWDAVPLDTRWLVADPSRGSRHNRGAAVDVTLYELATGRTVEMPSTYDESTQRAYAEYPGGTSRQRWHREVLRRAMVAEGFVVNDHEWWHFDHPSWRSYPIGNEPFDRLSPAR